MDRVQCRYFLIAAEALPAGPSAHALFITIPQLFFLHAEPVID